MLTGCGSKIQTQIFPVTTAVKSTNSITLENRKPNLPDVDPATISPNNPGYTIDVDGDGIIDFITLENNTLYFIKNNVGEKVPILTIKGNLLAYNVCILPNKTLPSLLFWDTNKKGYYQDNLGNNANGIPFFGEVENQ